jgi:hypothetical protein
MSTPRDSIRAIRAMAAIAHDPNSLDDLSESAFLGLVAAILGSAGFDITEVTRRGDSADYWINHRKYLLRLLKTRRDTLVRRSSLKALVEGHPFGDCPVVFVSSGRLSEDASEFAAKRRDSLVVIDRDILTNLITTTNQDLSIIAVSVAQMIRGFSLKERGRFIVGAGRSVSTPDLLANLGLSLAEKQRLIRCDELPLSVFSQIVKQDPEAMRNITPRQFEEFVARLLEGIGFQDIVLTPQSRDGGRDIIASKVLHDIPLTFFFECKKYAEGNKVQLNTIRALLGVVTHEATKANVGVLVTTSSFTRGSWNLIASDTRLDGKDYQGVLRWVDEYRTNQANRLIF